MLDDTVDGIVMQEHSHSVRFDRSTEPAYEARASFVQASTLTNTLLPLAHTRSRLVAEGGS